MKNFALITLLLSTVFGFSQQLTYKSNGNVYDSQDERIRPSEMRKLLETKPGLLNFYNEARTKKTVGNVMLIGGTALIAADLLVGLGADVKYPGAMTYIGVASMLIAIPVKSGFSKKIRTVVDDYNKEIALSKPKPAIERIAVCVNGNGAGLQIIF